MGLTILSIAIALFVVLLIVVLTWGRRWKLPEGPTSSAEYRGYEVTVIGGSVSAATCARAVWAVHRAAKQAEWRNVPDRARWFVHASQSSLFCELYTFARDSCPAATLVRVSRRIFGGSAPMAAVNIAKSPTVEIFAGVVIHEVTHDLIRLSGLTRGWPHPDPSVRAPDIYDDGHKLDAAWVDLRRAAMAIWKGAQSA